MITYDTDPSRYRHWTLSVTPPVATLTLTVDEMAVYDQGIS